MDTYEKKYKEALEKAKEFYILCKKCGAKDTIDFLEDSFSELKKSEDDRIRKALIRFHKSSIDIDGIKGDDILAWLEKQGKERKITHEEICKSYAIAEMQKGWSEEDETNLTNTIIMLKEGASHHFTNFSIVPCVDWLKSLKDRHTWKPSDEQMKALHDLNLTGNLSYAGQGQVLVELYNDLLKLKA